MSSVENEELIRQEIEGLEKDREAMTDCGSLLDLIKKISDLNPSEIKHAEDQLEEVWRSKPLLTINTMMNILALDKRGEINAHLHKVVCTVLAIYLGKATLNSDSDEDAKILIHWFNKLAYIMFVLTEGEEKIHSVCLPFVKLFTNWDFFAKDDFAQEIYFRFVKKHFADCLSENKLSMNQSDLAKLLAFLDTLIQDDERILTYSLPRLVSDSISALCLCSEQLCRQGFTEDKERTLTYVQAINSAIGDLLRALTTHFAKYSTQALDVVTNRELTNHLVMVAKFLLQMLQFINLPELKGLDMEKGMLLRAPLVKIVNCLVIIARRFEIEIKSEAQKHQDKIQALISQYDFRPAFLAVCSWINQTMTELTEIGQLIGPSDPLSAQQYYHESLELMALSIELPALSLDLQREVDK